MVLRRRYWVHMKVLMVLALMLLGALPGSVSRAAPPDGPMGVERVARLTPVGYQSSAKSDDETRWVQIDLGRSFRIDSVKLLPQLDWGAHSQGFPVRFRIQASDDPLFKTAVTIADYTSKDYPDPGDKVGVFPAVGIRGRFVRVTATRLRQQELCFTKIDVLSGGKDVAVGRPAADSVKGDLGRDGPTRPPRPQGEEVVTDNPGNVIPVSQWKPVAYKANRPLTGVQLGDGLFKTAMQNNIGYLLHSFTVDEMLRQFRDRAGKPSPAGLRPPDSFWDEDLPGSSAGRFLMGAGNTLRWIDSPELRSRMNQLVDGIAECRERDGNIMAYPENTIFYSERAAYTRSWLTRGLVAAGYGGNPKAFQLLRGYYDWFDHCPYLPELLRRAGQGVQGMIANTRMYFTPVGKPEDLQVVQRYFQENYWLDELSHHEDRAIWQYPYDHPHCYLITSLEPYLDLYRATGSRRYLDASVGGWDLFHDEWEHVGGSIAICEGGSYPPRSYYLHRQTGEFCGSVFWVRYNQRFHLLYPDQVKYVDEIEKSIYNVALANQSGSKGIRYHANLVGHKDPATAKNTCCEGQGTRLIGSLPEYIFSKARDGLYVDLFSAATISWRQDGSPMTAKMVTQFPFKPDVAIHLSMTRPIRSRIRIRVPGWAAHAMPIRVNGALYATGKPGRYVVLNRIWRNGDSISFTLPMAFRLTPYTGADPDGQDCYALEYGPILMAVTGPMDEHKGARLSMRPADLVKSLQPIKGQPLHFSIAGDAAHQYMPYWQVDDQVFTCYPDVAPPGVSRAAAVGPDDLALASKGAVAASDSEYAQEPGCTAKAIDGIIATPADFSNRWHSSLETPHPHWIQVTLPHPAKIGRIVIRFADPAGHPTRFEGILRSQGKDRVVFNVKDYAGWHNYETRIRPMTADRFRLIIFASANPAYPNAAQVSEIEMYAK